MKLKENDKILAAVFAMFLLVQGIGIYLGTKLISVITVAPMQSAEMGGFVFLYIMFATAVMLVMIRFIPWILKVLEFLAIFFSAEVFFEVVLMGFAADETVLLAAVVLALALAVIRVLHRTLLTQNASILISIMGVGALLGSYMGFIPAITLLAALTFYDIVAVFYTKHMVTLAKEVTKQKLAFTMAIPTKKHLFQLGGGDMIMPLIFTVSVLREFGLAVALGTMVGSMVVLVGFFAWLFSRPGRAYPALPPVTIGACFGFVISLGAKIALGL